MSITTPTSTDTNGNPITGTSGTQISNPSATNLSSTEFLNLMMDQLENQDPLSPSSSDPTEYLSELAQMTSVEQETNTAQSTATSVTEQAVSQAVGLIGDSVTYTDQSTGEAVTGTVNSVQITSSGPTVTVDGIAGIAPSTITNVTAPAAAGSSAATSSSGSDTSSSDQSA